MYKANTSIHKLYLLINEPLLLVKTELVNYQFGQSWTQLKLVWPKTGWLNWFDQFGHVTLPDEAGWGSNRTD